MQNVSYTCDVCKSDYDVEAAHLSLNSHARVVGGDIVYRGDEPHEWPIMETNPDLCPGCSIAVIEALNDRIEL